LLATLFHKGHENEDEISFFVICSESNYESYIKLRNDFEDWCQERDRDDLHVKVVDGNDIPYSRSYSWNDLFLPKDLKEDLRNTVEVFLSSRDFYESHGLPWKRGLLLYGEPGCGKSSIIKTIMSNYNFKPVTIGPSTEPSTLRDAFSYAEEQSPSLLYFEDLDSLLQKVDVSEFLNLMDGISTKNGLLVIATANDISRFKTNITDRPSRFDRKIKVPSPDFSMSLSYIKKMFGPSLTIEKVRSLAKIVSSHSFSYAYIKELYISSMFEAISNSRKRPTEKDIYNALDKVMKDKNITKSGKVTMNKYVKKNEVS
jgi:SpoVK/Ycf46/Vps4 family AAA+-type ATPase